MVGPPFGLFIWRWFPWFLLMVGPNGRELPPFPPPPIIYTFPQDLNHLDAQKNRASKKYLIFSFFLYSTYFFTQLLSKKQENNDRIGSEYKNEYYSITMYCTYDVLHVSRDLGPYFMKTGKDTNLASSSISGQLLGILRSRAPTFLC